MQAERQLRWISTASVLVASTLALSKIIAWWWTDSVSLLASLTDSLLDIAASLINFFAIRYALQPPDAEHRFGHGKAESIAGLAQAGFVGGSALFLLIHALQRFIHPVTVHETEAGMAVMLFSIVLTLMLVLAQRVVVRNTGSTAIKADSLHYLTDLLSNAGVLLALALTAAGHVWADAVVALLIAVYILHSAWEIGHEAFEQLMDRELPDEDRAKILSLASSVPGVLGVHELKTRRAGTTVIIQLHLEMDPGLTLQQAHEIADEVERALRRSFPGADVITHQDPAGLLEPGQRCWDVSLLEKSPDRAREGSVETP